MLGGTWFELQQASLKTCPNNLNTLNIYPMKKVLLCVNNFNFPFAGGYLA